MSHAKYLARCLSLLPYQYTQEDSNHISLANFTIAALEIVDGLPDQAVRYQQIEWIYRHYLTDKSGFRGSLNILLPKIGKTSRYDTANLAATYFGLSTLLILSDDLSKVNNFQVMSNLTRLQRNDGSFSCSRQSQIVDIRYSYLAIATRFIIQKGGRNVEGIPDVDISSAITFIRRCRNLDGAYGQSPGSESHAGLTFCALAALALAEAQVIGRERDDTVAWLVERQGLADGGLNGRPGKISDVCYSFWVLSSLRLLQGIPLVNITSMNTFLDESRSFIGGYAKYPNEPPDIFHTYMALAAQKLSETVDIKTCALSLSERAWTEYISK